jgi:hypothetical protein
MTVRILDAYEIVDDVKIVIDHIATRHDVLVIQQQSA